MEISGINVKPLDWLRLKLMGKEVPQAIEDYEEALIRTMDATSKEETHAAALVYEETAQNLRRILRKAGIEDRHAQLIENEAYGDALNKRRKR